jgi:hypothetical protein
MVELPIFINNKLNYSRKEGLHDGTAKLKLAQLNCTLAKMKY